MESYPKWKNIQRRKRKTIERHLEKDIDKYGLKIVKCVINRYFKVMNEKKAKRKQIADAEARLEEMKEDL